MTSAICMNDNLKFLIFFGEQVQVLGLFIVYLIILFGERIQSLVRASKNHVLMKDGLHRYMTILSMISMIGTILLIFVQAGIRIGATSAFNNNMISSEDYQRYVWIAIILLYCPLGCLLLSGMVHTEYTIPGIQFGAYGALIGAMIVKVVLIVRYGPMTEHAYDGWMALIYVIAFSMAIPVVYPSEIEKKHLFHVIECVVSAIMVVMFTAMLVFLFIGRFAWVFHPGFILFAIVGDIVILAMRWKETINWFVLIFLILSVLLWIAGMIAGVGF